MSKIIISIPLTKYLREITKDWGSKVYLTKTSGGHVWLSNESPGECFEDEGPNYIEFNESDVWIRLPKEVHQYIDLKAGSFKALSEVLKEIKQKEN